MWSSNVVWKRRKVIPVQREVRFLTHVKEAERTNKASQGMLVFYFIFMFFFVL
jgi:hypothetical protein